MNEKLDRMLDMLKPGRIELERLMRATTDEELLALAAAWDAYVPTAEEQAALGRAMERTRQRLHERLAGLKAGQN